MEIFHLKFLRRTNLSIDIQYDIIDTVTPYPNEMSVKSQQGQFIEVDKTHTHKENIAFDYRMLVNYDK